MKTAASTFLLLCVLYVAPAFAQGNAPYGGYIYEAPSFYRVPPYPVVVYEYAPPAYFAPPLPRTRVYRPLAPAGFGEPWYNGRNDPYFHSYGPGIREFLHFGGADFYGW